MEWNTPISAPISAPVPVSTPLIESLKNQVPRRKKSEKSTFESFQDPKNTHALFVPMDPLILKNDTLRTMTPRHFSFLPWDHTKDPVKSSKNKSINAYGSIGSTRVYPSQNSVPYEESTTCLKKKLYQTQSERDYWKKEYEKLKKDSLKLQNWRQKPRTFYKKCYRCYVCHTPFHNQVDLDNHCLDVGHFCCRTCTQRNGQHCLFVNRQQLCTHLKTVHPPHE